MEIEPSRGCYPRPRFYKVEQTMIISTAGVDLLTHFEGLRLEAYQDSVGVWTIGYGHTKGVIPSMKITESQANNLLKTELIEYQNYINEYIKSPGTADTPLWDVVINNIEKRFYKSL